MKSRERQENYVHSIGQCLFGNFIERNIVHVCVANE